jgi:Holliday junction resolvase RusA-like endonuclease
MSAADSLSIIVYGTPQAAGSKRHVGGGRIIDANKNAAGWKGKVAQVAGEAREGKPLMRGPVGVRFTFYRARPKGHLKKDGSVRDSAPIFPTTKPDVLKLARGVEDALSGVVYADDSLIVHEELCKLYGPGSAEGVHIFVWEI